MVATTTRQASPFLLIPPPISTAAVIAAPISQEQQERIARLARQAEADGVLIEEERPGQYVAWREDEPFTCQIVTATSCTCHRFRLWRACEHHALVVQRLR